MNTALIYVFIVLASVLMALSSFVLWFNPFVGAGMLLAACVLAFVITFVPARKAQVTI